MKTRKYLIDINGITLALHSCKRKSTTISSTWKIIQHLIQ